LGNSGIDNKVPFAYDHEKEKANQMIKKKQKSNQLALILSGLFPGLGQFYNGDWAKGAAFFMGYILLEGILLPEGWWNILRGGIPFTSGLLLRLAILSAYFVVAVIDADRSAKNKNRVTEGDGGDERPADVRPSMEG